MSGYDAIVVGSGPNGLAAALTLAGAGRSVLVVEGAATVGGGCRSAELTLPGFVHDVCSAVHPLVAGSPFFRSLPLAELGVELVHPEAPTAHPLPDGTAVTLERSVAATAAGLGPDAAAYRALMGPLARKAEALIAAVLAPPLRPPRHPLALARFAPVGLRSAIGLGRRFSGEGGRALLAGMAAHSFRPLDAPVTGGFGLLLAMLGHAVGWPVVRGGSGRLADAMAARLVALGGEIETGRLVTSLDGLPPARAVLLDVAPRQALGIVGARLPAAYRRRLARYRHGPGAFKVDWALAGPIPWRAPECARAATVHLGGTMAEIAASEAAVAAGEHPEHPFVLLAQQTVADPGRAPEGGHTAWAYCHVPNGSPVDMTERVERQVERFAPGFRDLVLARAVRPPARLERENPNYVGGDITGGLQDLRQILARPVARPDPYATPAAGVYLCSSSTPPGGGVHGMCGHLAARSALRRELRGA
ncbi:MAG TPA: NAD(P)/FAD-dependent oxidoreductase [Miltoncostaeaceae bacterium]|nr:NAD(P)/FAD-dependent oxidoreductase [Miltoncostaeaceae bacterium]